MWDLLLPVFSVVGYGLGDSIDKYNLVRGRAPPDVVLRLVFAAIAHLRDRGGAGVGRRFRRSGGLRRCI